MESEEEEEGAGKHSNLIKIELLSSMPTFFSLFYLRARKTSTFFLLMLNEFEPRRHFAFAQKGTVSEREKENESVENCDDFDRYRGNKRKYIKRVNGNASERGKGSEN